MSSATRFVFLVLLAVVSGIPLTAQNKSKKDTVIPPVDSTKFFSFNEYDFLVHVIDKKSIPGTLSGVTTYRPTQAGLGNLGQPEKNLSLFSLPEPGFNRGRENFDFFGYDNDRRKTFYDVQRPYTNITAVLGMKQEQFVRITHAQNFSKRFNLAFGFNRNRSEGFYLRQQVDNTALFLSSFYRSRSNRYSLLFYTYWKTASCAENGGIANDTTFEENTTLNRQLIGVNLAQAETFIRRRGVWAKQYFAFGEPFPDKLQDTTQKRKSIEPRSALFLITSLEDRDFQYTDKNPTDGFYSTIYNDSLLTNDSTHLLKLDNSIGWQLLGVRNFYSDYKPAVIISAGHQGGHIWQDTITANFSDVYLQGSIELRNPYFSFRKIVNADSTPGIEYQGGFTGAARARYIVTGTHAGDFTALVKLAYSFTNKNKLGITADITQRTPEWLFMHYSGNHYRWLNDFQQTGLTRITLEDEWLPARLKLGAALSTYSKPVYFDTVALPAQLNGSVTGYTLYLQHLLHLKWFNLQSTVLYNQLPDSSVIRLPALTLRHSMFAELTPKKRPLKIQMGVDVFYNTKYLADAYMPNTSQFYLQNKRELGNYPYLDFWLSMKIRSVRLFVKLDHLNSGLMGNTYYMVPHYPQNDRSLKFGVSWTFND